MAFSRSAFFLAVAGLYLTGCASGVYKERQEQREKLSNSSGLYCEFVNGEQHPDVDVELNMQMAKRCDMNKHFVITNYKTSSEMNGIMYCCHQLSGGKRSVAKPATKPAPPPSKPEGPSTPPHAKPSPPAADTGDDDVVAD